jgi:hypothetical protein
VISTFRTGISFAREFFQTEEKNRKSFKENMWSFLQGNLDGCVLHWLPLAFLNHGPAFPKKAVESVHNSNYKDDGIDSFSMGRNGDCCAYLLRFCLLFLKFNIVESKNNFEVVKGLLLKKPKTETATQRLVLEVENQITVLEMPNA